MFSCRDNCKNVISEAGIDSSKIKIDTAKIALIDSSVTIPADSVITPFGYSLLQNIKGNLDADLSNEMVIIYNTNVNDEDGAKRVLKIFNKVDSNWVEMAVCTECILSSESGGVLGDPFRSVSIKNGVLFIEHFGGSKIEWQYTHKYKLDDKQTVKLLGITKVFTDGNIISTTDANLSTGLVHFYEVEQSINSKGKLCQKVNVNKRLKMKHSDTVNFENMNTKWFMDFELPAGN